MGEQDKPEAPRIAIKLGGLGTGSTKKSSRPAPSSSLGKRQRTNRGLGGDSESESGDEQDGNGRHQRITAFGENGAEFEGRDRDKRARADSGPLAIARQPNRDWRSEARARRHRDRRGPSRAHGADADKEIESADKDKPIKWGLTITKKEPEADGGSSKQEGDGEDKEGKTLNGDAKSAQRPTQTGDNKDDGSDKVEKDAVAALLGKTADDKTGTRHIIERVANEPSEDDVFRRDFKDAPDESTLEDYERMPVEEFGAALLRGMGWDGKDRGPKVKQVKRRPNQLGLGAKELKGSEDLGAWNQKTGGSGSGSRQQRPPKLHDYRREEDKRRERREERYRDSYKAERDRERDEQRRNGHSSSHRHYSSNDSRGRYR